MPYVKQDDRVYIETFDKIRVLAAELKGSPGKVNYAITRLLDEIYELKENPRYFKFNEAIGILECVKLELYRRLAAPYEDEMKTKNGDVY